MKQIKNKKIIFLIFFAIIFNFYSLLYCAASQTLAHLEAWDNENFLDNVKMKDAFGESNLKKYENIIRTMIQKEIYLKNTHYVFYQASNNFWYVIQDIEKQLFRLSKKIDEIDLEHFEAFRLPGDPKYDKFKNVQEYLEDQINTNTYVNDHRGEVGDYLLSVNLALFGNTETDTECTFDYFLKNKGATTKLDIPKIMTGILKAFGITASFDKTNKIQQLVSMVPGVGAINQIFIPKNIVEQQAYLARNYGQPYGSPEVLGIFFDRKDRTKRLSNYWKLLKNNPEQALGNPKKHSIDKILERYINMDTAGKIPNFDQLQARILMSNEFLLNPKSGVQIYRYSGYNTPGKKHTLDKYKDEMRKIVNQWWKTK